MKKVHLITEDSSDYDGSTKHITTDVSIYLNFVVSNQLNRSQDNLKGNFPVNAIIYNAMSSEDETEAEQKAAEASMVLCIDQTNAVREEHEAEQAERSSVIAEQAERSSVIAEQAERSSVIAEQRADKERGEAEEAKKQCETAAEEAEI